ncbi:hypothetical protein D4764_19G0007420 [Takifugu flavidus]|uniref:Uncharacterized protein n=1 Tax=Takifugu flavidus TaxID=433684 RepID=A0A5C6NNG6_9TELE|nr:hypothetical protein D4764_19G0007420 [Takifugu flavidus]
MLSRRANSQGPLKPPQPGRGCHCLDQSAPATADHYRRSAKTRQLRSPDVLTALHRLKPDPRLSPSLPAALISAENSFIFSPPQTLCAEEFALNFLPPRAAVRMRGAAMRTLAGKGPKG